ncbi:hypothetical protein KC460_01750 [Candidatus Dependentiae bacterium]|nr:hypothetical protein [Candidatus Dependentiae bacterium]
MKYTHYVPMFLLFFSFALQSKSAITYTTVRGRTGDHIIKYAKAKWVAHKYAIDFLYKPFPYSEQLNLHDIEKQYMPENETT